MSDNDPIQYIPGDRPPKVGDRVHVEFDATVVTSYTDEGWLHISINEGDPYHPIVPIAAMTVIVPPVKVGDVIDAVDAEDLPRGSAILCEANGLAYVRPSREDGLWTGSARMIARYSGPCRVLHIGDGR